MTKPVSVVAYYRQVGAEPMVNPLFWLVFKQNNDVAVFIQPAGELVTARLKAALAGIEGIFQEGYKLDSKTSKKVPKAQIRKILSRKEATALLKKLE